MLMINNSVELIRPVNGSREKHAIVMPQSAKHHEYSSFSKLENHDKQFCRTHTAREWLERQTCYSNAQKRKTFSKRENHDKQFCRTHTTREWLERQTCYSNGVMPQSAKHDEYSSFSKRENRKALRPKTHANHDEYSSVSKRENLVALYVSQSNEYFSFSKREDPVSSAVIHTSRTIGELLKYLSLHTDDKQSCRM